MWGEKSIRNDKVHPIEMKKAMTRYTPTPGVIL
jgi:hypothetical protein